MNRATLRTTLCNHFNLEELRTICFDLEIDYEVLGGDGKPAKVRALIEYCERNDCIQKLLTEIQKKHPYITLPIYDGSETHLLEKQEVKLSANYLFDLATEEYAKQNYHKAKSLCQELETINSNYPGLIELNNAIAEELQLETMSRRERIRNVSKKLRQKERTPRVWFLLIAISLLDLIVDFVDILEWMVQKINDLPLVKKTWEFLRVQMSTLIRALFN